MNGSLQISGILLVVIVGYHLTFVMVMIHCNKISEFRNFIIISFQS